MHLPSYTISEIAEDHSTYKFFSEGPNGRISKIIIFSEFYAGGNIYNVALGDVMRNDRISDTNVSNNGDIRKIFATVAQVLMDYTSIYPERTIFFQGSDVEGRRISVYHRAISQYYHLLQKELIVEGITNHEVKELFNPNGQYAFFLIRRK
jgi:hypothetical protein